MMVTVDGITSKIIHAQTTDEYISTIKKLMTAGKADQYILKNQVLFKIENDRDVLVVPTAMQTEVIKRIHDTNHFGVTKTETLVKQEYYFPNMRQNIEKVIANCVECILLNRKRGKGEGFLHPIPKEDVPLSTYHIDFIGPLPSTNKNYKHIFTVVDAFSKFVWFYPVKSTTTQDALQKLKQQQTVFGNPLRIITDRGAAFASKEFEEFCINENIQHISITTGMPRGNGQIERMHGTLIPILAKLSIDDPEKWYKHVDAVQRVMNATISRSTNRTPFELLTGVKMRGKENAEILKILEEERINSMMEEREKQREEAKKNILKVQDENRKSFNKTRKEAHIYKKGELVAIQRTQYGSGLKLRSKFYGPYQITTVKPNDRYEVKKVGQHEGPNITTTAADFMKPWKD